MKIWVDGSLACTCVVLEDNTILVDSLEHSNHKLTTNQAEYHAIIRGLGEAHKRRYNNVEIFSDSKLAVDQLNNMVSCYDRNLYNLRSIVRQITTLFHEVRFTWIPREQNPAGLVLDG